MAKEYLRENLALYSFSLPDYRIPIQSVISNTNASLCKRSRGILPFPPFTVSSSTRHYETYNCLSYDLYVLVFYLRLSVSKDSFTIQFVESVESCCLSVSSPATRTYSYSQIKLVQSEGQTVAEFMSY